MSNLLQTESEVKENLGAFPSKQDRATSSPDDLSGFGGFALAEEPPELTCSPEALSFSSDALQLGKTESDKGGNCEGRGLVGELPTKRDVFTCEPVYHFYECACGKESRKEGCNRLGCGKCAPFLGRRRAAAVRERVEGRLVLYTVFTVPESERLRVSAKGELKRIRKAAADLLKSFGMEYGYCAVHPVGEDGETFHPHLNFLWVQRAGFRPFLNVDKLRLAWGDILGVPVAVVWHGFVGSRGVKSQKKVAHWCKYVARTFPGWHWWTGSVVWYGRPPELRREPCPCPKCGEYRRYVGTLSADVVENWYSNGRLLGTPPPWEREWSGFGGRAGGLPSEVAEAG